MLGDSHCGVFEFCFDNGLLGRHLINCEIVGGATATGLANPRSTSGARARFEGAVLRYRRFDTIFLMLGEVDCSVTFWLLAARSAQAATDFIPRAVQNIAGMVEWIRKQVPGKAIFLVAAPLPSVTDEQSGQQELPLRQRIGASLAQRTALVHAYNRALHALARQQGLGWIDTIPDLLDPSTGLLDRRFCHEDRVDHHHCFEKTAPVWRKHLQQHLR